ncbi:uncharacterized protein LOC143265449 [Megachile rotundata]|uniref:uncharacterized protein LOC143265449 n=1 Tax=Megachile rotundata TaxID=143995 RepID=UPI003FD519BA
MVGFNRAEIVTRKREEANALLRKYSSPEGRVRAFLPRRMAYRKGIIFYECEDSVDELREEVMPGQGQYVLERMTKRRIIDGKVVFSPLRTILITFKGGVLPTRLLIGQGHVGIRIEPYVEPVKQCFRCLRFGHYQAQCREEHKRCAMCGDKQHGECDRKPKCLNCGGEHRSLARQC